jgi:hypothetical protein
MLWNQLDYGVQAMVIDRIVDLLKEENDSLVQDGIIAAVHELELWSNKDLDELHNKANDYVATAVEQDPFSDEGWDE